MTQNPNQSGAPDPYGTSQSPQTPANDGQLPDYRPPATGGPGQVPGTGQYGNPSPANSSAVVLSVISGLLTLTGVCCIVGIVPLILGILGITQNSSDPEKAQKLTRIGWIVLVLLSVLFVLAIIGAVFFVAVGGPSIDGYASL